MRRASCLLSIILLGVLPGSSSADLVYKVRKVVKQSDLNSSANQNVPMVVTGLNASGRLVGFYSLYIAGAHGRPPQNDLHAFLWDDATQTSRDINGDMSGFAASSSMALCVNDAGVCWLAAPHKMVRSRSTSCGRTGWARFSPPRPA